MKKRIAIVGGGISGLTAAYILHRDHASTCEFSLFEASPRVGGIIETVRADGFVVECGPDSWVTEKPWATQLAQELGLGDELISSNDSERRTYIAQKAKLIPLPDGMRMMVPTNLDAALASPLFTESAKRAYAAEPARAAELRRTALLRRDAQADESVASFVRRHFGEEIAATVAGPLLAGIFGGNIEKLSARALLGPFLSIEANQGSLISGLQQRSKEPAAPVFTTLSTGLDTLVDRLVAALPPPTVQYSSPVTGIRRGFACWSIDLAETTREFDGVLIATSVDPLRRLLASLALPEAQRAAASLPADAASGLVVALGYKADAKPFPVVPKGFGYLSATDSLADDSLLACTFLHDKFHGRAPNGAVLLRAFFASSAADALAHRPDHEISSIAQGQLSQYLGPLPQQADVTVVRRWPRSLPQYETDHLSRIKEFQSCLTALDGLAVAGNALHGVGLPDLIRDATQAAHQLAQD